MTYIHKIGSSTHLFFYFKLLMSDTMAALQLLYYVKQNYDTKIER